MTPGGLDELGHGFDALVLPHCAVSGPFRADLVPDVNTMGISELATLADARVGPPSRMIAASRLMTSSEAPT